MLKKYAGRAWHKLVVGYRPVDAALRRYPVYGAPAARVAHVIRRVAGEFAAPSRYYIEHYDRLELKPEEVLFESFWGRKVGCNPYACYRALRDDPSAENLRFVWVRNAGVPIPADVLGDRRVRFVVHGTRAYVRGLLSAGCLVSNSTFPPYFVRRPGQRYVNFWHGVPLKHMGRDSDPALSAVANTQRNFLQATAIALPGAYAASKIVPPYEAAGLTMPVVRGIGSPRIDLTLGSRRGAVRAKLNVPLEKRLVLYAPTWRGRVQGVSEALEDPLSAIRVLGALENTVVLVSLHHYTRAKVGELPDGCTFVPDDLDMNEVLAAVDVLVSDYSSIIVDYLVLDRPVVLYLPDQEAYEAERGMYVRPHELPATLARDLEALAAAVLGAQNPATFEHYGALLARLLPQEDGCAAQRGAALCLSSAAVAASVSRRRRLLFYPGSLASGPVTEAFLRHLATLDQAQFEVFVLVDSEAVDSEPERGRNCAAVASRGQLIIRRPTFRMTYAEEHAYRALGERASVSAEDQGLLHRGFAREARRILGESHFDVAVDFVGDSLQWSLIMANVHAERAILVRHHEAPVLGAVVEAEMQRLFDHLHAVAGPRNGNFVDVVPSRLYCEGVDGPRSVAAASSSGTDPG